MQSLRRIKNRIRAVENTHKVTDAMEKISVTKLNRIDNVLFAIRPYFLKLDTLLQDFICNAGEISHPFLEERAEKKKIGLCVITSDSGLCGLYNSNVIRLVEDFIKKQEEGRIKFLFIGKKGFSYFKGRQIEILKTYIGLHGKYQQEISDEIAGYLTDIFLSNDVDEIYTAYTHYETALILKPILRKVLNIEKNSRCAKETEYIIEPSARRVTEELLSRYIYSLFRLMLLEAFTSEHAARTVAMKMATDNAEELLKRLFLMRNKVRQADITNEMMEIIASSEALKG